MGLTEVALQPERWVTRHSNYDRFFRDLLANGLVPLMEWCSREQRIVIDHPVDRLVLLAVRNVTTGEYLPLNMMLELAVDYQVEPVRRYPGTVESMQHLVTETRDLQNQEGWVIWFDNGYRIKIKADDYVRIHRAKDALMQEKNLLELILEEKLDDVKGFLPVEDLARVENYERAFWQGVAVAADTWKRRYGMIKVEHGSDRKSFALDTKYQNLDGNLKSAVFRYWDNADANWQEAVLDVIRKNLGTQTKVDEVRKLHGAPRWRAAQTGDE